MPVLVDFTVPRYSDALLIIEMSPPESIGADHIEFLVQKRLGHDSSGLIRKSVMSGYGNGASGILIENSGNGVMHINIDAQDTSGLQPGNYQFVCNRLTSGNNAALSQGTLILLPR